MTIEAKNPRSIQGVFEAIAPRYDLTNSILSFGIHKLWKKQLIRESRCQKNDAILDCATGTGDLAFLFAKKFPDAKVIGCDFSQSMLDVAKMRRQKNHLRVHFEWADATKLPYEDQSFDVISISFGIRNVSDPALALKEFFRILRPRGRLLVLEFGQPEKWPMKPLYQFYSRFCLPKIGGFLSGDKEAYEYLQSSSHQFPYGNRFLELARGAPFSEQSFRKLQGGIAYLYTLKK